MKISTDILIICELQLILVASEKKIVIDIFLWEISSQRQIKSLDVFQRKKVKKKELVAVSPGNAFDGAITNATQLW